MAESSTPTMTGDGTMPIERGAPWAINYHSDDLTLGSLNVELVAAPTRDNSALYIESVTFGVVSDADFDFVYDVNLTLVDGAGSEVFGPVQFVDSGQTVFTKDFKHPLKITDKKALDLTGSGRSGYEAACFVFVEGFTADKPLG